jgi:hypothetical protein
MFHPLRHGRRALLALATAAMLLTFAAGTVAAHSHKVNEGTDRERLIANGQNHYAFVLQADGTYLTCDTFAALPNVGPAWYGLETAHHGPDSGDPGRGDGCYLADASPLSEDDDQNRAID